MDPTTIGLLISIAPTVLDLLFGRGNIIKHETLLENPERMYGYGLDGYGYRYPRRKRQLTAETYFPENVRPDLVRAAVFNRAIAAKNPWIQHLKEKGVYKKIQEELQKARESYKPPPKTDKQKRALSTQLKRLHAELNILKDEAKNKSLLDEFKDEFGGDEKFYETLLSEKISKLENEINNIKKFL
jgi:hypothetical protein